MARFTAYEYKVLSLDLWTQTIDTLRELVPPYDFTHWIRPIECTHIDNEKAEITLSVPDESHGKWVKDQPKKK